MPWKRNELIERQVYVLDESALGSVQQYLLIFWATSNICLVGMYNLYFSSELWLAFELKRLKK